MRALALVIYEHMYGLLSRARSPFIVTIIVIRRNLAAAK